MVMNRIRSLAFAIVFYGLSVPIVLLAPLISLAGPAALRRYTMVWTGFLHWCVRSLLGIRIRVEGAPIKGPALYAAKHQAMFETLELAGRLDAPAIVMKRELAAIPVWGWASRRYGVIAIDRAASATALRAMMRDAKAAQAEGRSVLIFPEGTRVVPGEAPPLRPGFAGLYRALAMPVVPVALDSGRLLPRKGTKRSGVITIRFGEPIAPGLSRAEVEAAVHEAINVLERDPA